MYICAYIINMDYQWDIKKAGSNLKKHEILFADAVSVFSDDYAVTVKDDYPNEQRFVTVGMDAFARVLVVVYTWRRDIIRIISARKATAHERKQYERMP